jgi:aspartate/methionine/tyrosine aminotransferase
VNRQQQRLSTRVTEITESSTLAIDSKAKALKADGEDVIGFGAGEPDFPTPEHIVAAAAAACRETRFHRYTPAAGLPELRSAIARKTKRDSGFEVEASQVLVTNGGKHALYNAFMSLVDPGDEVLLPAPYWVSYPEMIKLAGGRAVPLGTTQDSGFKVSVDQLEQAVTERTKALVFVSPSNPTGAVYTSEEVERIGRWAGDRGLWVVTDEIYEHLVYGEARFASMPVSVPELADRTIVINGVAKTYAMTGWRVGWMIAPADVVTAATSLQSHTTSNVSNVAQAASLAALEGDLSCVHQMREAFDRRRRTMVKLLADMPGVDVIEPLGAFYAFPCVTDLLGCELGGRVVSDTNELAAAVLDAAKVAVVPGDGFGAPGYLRLSYALGDEEMVQGLERIGNLISSANGL